MLLRIERLVLDAVEVDGAPPPLVEHAHAFRPAGDREAELEDDVLAGAPAGAPRGPGLALPRRRVAKATTKATGHCVSNFLVRVRPRPACSSGEWARAGVSSEKRADLLLGFHVFP